MQRAGILSAIKRVEFVDRREFVAVALAKGEGIVMVPGQWGDALSSLHIPDEFYA